MKALYITPRYLVTIRNLFQKKKRKTFENRKEPSVKEKENLFISRQQYQYTPVKNNNAVYINEENNNTRYMKDKSLSFYSSEMISLNN